MSTEGTATHSFQTHLALEASEWRVNLDETLNDLTRAATGMSVQEIAEKINEAAAEASGVGGTGETVGQTAAAPQAPPVSAPASSSFTNIDEEPWFPTQTGTIQPGWTAEDVVSVWGDPVLERTVGDWKYLYFRNGCERACGTYDLVILERNQVVDAIVRGTGHTYAGVSSSPPGRLAEFTPGTSPTDSSGIIG